MKAESAIAVQPRRSRFLKWITCLLTIALVAVWFCSTVMHYEYVFTNGTVWYFDDGNLGVKWWEIEGPMPVNFINKYRLGWSLNYGPGWDNHVAKEIQHECWDSPDRRFLWLPRTSKLLHEDDIGVLQPTYADPNQSASGAAYEREIIAPIWPVVLILSVMSAIQFWRDRRRGGSGHCGQCGYDLTGNVSGVCPECGEATGGGRTGWRRTGWRRTERNANSPDAR